MYFINPRKVNSGVWQIKLYKSHKTNKQTKTHEIKSVDVYAALMFPVDSNKAEIWFVFL